MTSSDTKDQEVGMLLADEMLKKNNTKEINENEEVKIKMNRTLINKFKPEDSNPENMSRGEDNFYTNIKYKNYDF